MKFQVLFTREFLRRFKKLDGTVKERIQKAVDALAEDPYQGKRLTGVLADRWSYRVGDYRILYKIFQDRFVILALTVGHRRDVYR
ncbi:MAG: type II toxin-antitoxin system RelE/ParE family toxin [Elusimicrobia bacterium]|nr:type II toxin-antitoxin system RelE/ParE family toxin [Candidatus Obscuribacterium magneticum]